MSQFIVEHADEDCTFKSAKIFYNDRTISSCWPIGKGPEFTVEWDNCEVKKAHELVAIEIVVWFSLKGENGEEDIPIRKDLVFKHFVEDGKPEVLERIFNGESAKIVFDHGKSEPEVIFVPRQGKSGN